MKTRKNKGITLIALVITIIILLILAGVTISTLSESGLFNKTELAKEKASESEAIEKVKLAVMASYKENGQLSYGNIDNKLGLENNLNNIKGISAKITENITTFPVVVIVDGHKIKITEYGIVELYNENDNDNNDNDDENNDDNDDNESNIEEEKATLALLEHFEEHYEGIPEEKLSTENKKLGNASLYLNNTEITNTNSTQFNCPSDFTIDYWLKLSNENLTQEWAPNLTVSTRDGMWIGLHSGKYVVRGWATSEYLAIDAPQTDEWVHIAVCRKDGIIYVFYNGILQGQVNNTNNFAVGVLNIGSDGAGAYTKNSYIDELRIINNEAKWTSNFTIPDTEYNYTEGIIYHFNIPSSTEITANTAILSSTEKKFGNYSKYLNNTYTEYKSNEKFGFSSDFTIDYWLKLSSEALTQEWAPILAVPTRGGIWIGLHSGKYVVKGWAIEENWAIDAPPTDEWVHIAVCRKNGIIYVFYNGILQGQSEDTNIFPQGVLNIGTEGTGEYIKNSYIDELRILNGYCAWTENFTVPTSEYNY